MGPPIDQEFDGWVQNTKTDRFTFYIRTTGSALNQQIPAMRAIYRFPNIEDPSLIMKAFNKDRHLWNKASYEILENLDEYKTSNLVV